MERDQASKFVNDLLRLMVSRNIVSPAEARSKAMNKDNFAG